MARAKAAHTEAVMLKTNYRQLQGDGIRCNVRKNDKLTCAQAEDSQMKECRPTTLSCFKVVGHGNTSLGRPVGFQNVPFNEYTD
ncbi:hypothetical protein RvY_06499 [Ramazzottius varieornatus]|uniref:Uncharacterized protein n=1 Tax=Ramazzottius varieornatus TaxID=947166 RepID=A0A1D1V495_RAMVA|nr:hypothetical protein RvY_06499 [Ramazzottius varieornatus]